MYYLPSLSPESPARKSRVSARLSRLLKLAPRFELAGENDPGLESARQFASQIFSQAFDARLEHFLPQFLTMHCADTLSGAVGLDFASQGPLFLEQYLDNPIEYHIESETGIAIARHSIVEIGNLVARNNGASLALFIVLASALHAAGYKTMAFTASRGLRDKFDRLGFKTVELARADESRLSGELGTDWGRYYDQDPLVMGGSLDAALALIQDKSLYRLLRCSLRGQIDSLIDSLVSAQ